MSEHYKETTYGFEWGSADISRGFSDEKKGWVTLILRTKKYDLQIYVTKTGKVRIHDENCEWLPEKKNSDIIFNLKNNQAMVKSQNKIIKQLTKENELLKIKIKEANKPYKR